MRTGQSESLTEEDKEQQLSESSEEGEEGVRLAIRWVRRRGMSGVWLK